MALKTVRIGSSVDIAQYDDADLDSGIECDGPIKAGSPIDPNDVLRLDDIASLIVATGTYAARPAVTPADNGLIYYATDQNVLYIVNAGVWVYLSGVMKGTVAPDTRPALVTDDIGFRFIDTDTFHEYYWKDTYTFSTCWAAGVWGIGSWAPGCWGGYDSGWQQLF